MAEEIQKVGVFQEEPGKGSSMRWFSFIALLQAIGLSWYVIKLPIEQATNGMYLTIFWGVLAFAPKIAQKYAESWAARKVKE